MLAGLAPWLLVNCVFLRKASHTARRSMNNANAHEPASSPYFFSAYLRLARLIAYLGMATAVVAVAYAGYQAIRARDALHESQQKMVESFDLTTPTRRHLAPEYTDKGGRLLADAPADPGKLLDPESIVLSYGEDSDVEIQPVNWDGFQKYLSQVTGKKVVGQKYNNTVED